MRDGHEVVLDESVDGFAFDSVTREILVHLVHRESRDEREYAEVRHQRTVDRATDHTGQDAQHHSEQQRAGLFRCSVDRCRVEDRRGESGGESGESADRQVELSDDHHDRLNARDDRQSGDLLEDVVDQVALGEERVGIKSAEEPDEHDESERPEEGPNPIDVDSSGGGGVHGPVLP